MAVKRIDHIAIVVPNIEEAESFYRDALGLDLALVEEVEGQEVIVAFFPTGESEIELVEPINETSGVARYLAKRGPGIHHICVEVDDIVATLGRLKEKGVQLIDEEPTIGSGGKKVAFVHPRSTSGVLIELYELTPEEPQRRAAVIAGLQKRFDVERQALTAGMSAFLTRLRESTGLGHSGEVVIGSSRGIKLKAEGEMPEKIDGQN
jgi:methylmalonyl-CoA/ethylmalonyl-CoA epimerase